MSVERAREILKRNKTVIDDMKGRHYINIHVRKNGKDSFHEGDFLTDLIEVLEDLVTPKKRQYKFRHKETDKRLGDRP